METQKDFEELLELLNRNKVKYCVVGAYAVAFYSRPRYTKDMDIVVEATKENARRIVKTLADFGFESLKLKEQDFMEEGKIIQLGHEPIRVDLLTSIGGISFKQIWAHRVVGKYGRQKAFFIGLDELIKSKKHAGRKQDDVDISLLISKKSSS